MTDVQDLAALLTIAERAIAVVDTEAKRRSAKLRLDAAYVSWKQFHKIGRVEKDTLDWSRMMLVTKPQYEALADLKACERNARRRLETAVHKYRK